MNNEEQEFLKHYDISKYERPSLTTDIVIFSIMGQLQNQGKRTLFNSENFRKLPERKLKVLLIKRGGFPYKGCWALPGGFCRRNEDIRDTALRELLEETNVSNAHLQFDGIYSDEGRDPRGWIISNAFLALMDGETCTLRSGTDAWEARWFDLSFEKHELMHEYSHDTAIIENEYSLCLKSTDMAATNLEFPTDDNVITLKATVIEHKKFENFHETVRYDIKENDGFAFDHAKIIIHALLSLRRQAKENGRIVFDLMPEYFTLTDLQKAYELILEQKLLTANFRRKIADLVVETDQSIEGAGHRPAKLFKRNIEAFY